MTAIIIGWCVLLTVLWLNAPGNVLIDKSSGSVGWFLKRSDDDKSMEWYVEINFKSSFVKEGCALIDSLTKVWYLKQSDVQMLYRETFIKSQLQTNILI